MYAPANPIHTELQGMLLLGNGRFVADPKLIWGHVGLLGLIAYPLALLILARRWRADLGAFLVFWGAIAVLCLTFNPWFVPVVQRQLTYLVFRFSWFLPPAAAAMVVASALGAPGAAFSPRTRALVIALLLLGCAPTVRSAIPPSWLTEPVARREALVSPLPWRAGIEAMAARLPARAVVLTDPVTGYVLPALSGLKVTAVLDQHSSPNDSLAIERIVAARDVLSPAVPPEEAARIARASGAAYVLVNGRFTEADSQLVHDDGPARARRAAAPTRGFRRVGGGGARGWLRGVPPARDPRRRGDDTGLDRRRRVPIPPSPAPRSIAPWGSPSCAPTRDPSAWPSGTASKWTSPGRSPPGRSLPRHDSPRSGSTPWTGPTGKLPGGKLGRKILERVRGVRYRHRVDWIPGAGTGASALPPDRWRPGSGGERPRRRAGAGWTRPRTLCGLGGRRELSEHAEPHAGRLLHGPGSLLGGSGGHRHHRRVARITPAFAAADFTVSPSSRPTSARRPELGSRTLARPPPRRPAGRGRVAPGDGRRFPAYPSPGPRRRPGRAGPEGRQADRGSASPRTPRPASARRRAISSTGYPHMLAYDGNPQYWRRGPRTSTSARSAESMNTASGGVSSPIHSKIARSSAETSALWNPPRTPRAMIAFSGIRKRPMQTMNTARRRRDPRKRLPHQRHPEASRQRQRHEGHQRGLSYWFAPGSRPKMP